jgi:hypothetical protein
VPIACVYITIVYIKMPVVCVYITIVCIQMAFIRADVPFILRYVAIAVSLCAEVMWLMGADMQRAATAADNRSLD